MSFPRAALLVMILGLGLLTAVAQPGKEPVVTGPQTEQRFPPVQLPAGFKATLFACDPLIEYPSVIALGPRPGSLFVAVDFLTGLGTGIERHDEVRLLEDTNSDGYADKATVVASGFNSIQGLAYHGDTLFIIHSPYLSAVRVAPGTAVGEGRRDLLTGLGLAPEKDEIRLHNANGVAVGHDGWLYLALGDHGCDVQRPEGDRLLLEGGGILRCRLDGRDLHVFATGLRNIYDVALDDELNVFVRDNENDGGDYKIRVCHSFFGADHGYPYLYYERPDEALAPLANLGLGSSAGGVWYGETQFPQDYRGSLFFCEWGRAVVRYPLQRVGASFAPAGEVEFAAGAPNDPYGFKPTDLVIDRDGTVFVADWADGQRPRRGRGRIYRVRHVGADGAKRPSAANEPELPERLDDLVAQLDAESQHQRGRVQMALERRKESAAAVRAALQRLGVRGRLQAVWIMAKNEGPAAIEPLFAVARSDPDPRVAAQAVRAFADLLDPVLTQHRLDAGRGDPVLAERIAALATGRDPRVRLEAVIALGRLRWSGVPSWVRTNLKEPQGPLAHAAQWALRRAGSWPAVLELLDEPATESVHGVARRSIANQYEPALVDGLIERLGTETEVARRREYAELLARVCKKPAPWTYWGFRPPPRPAHPLAWTRTSTIEAALNRALAGAVGSARWDLLRPMLREKVPAALAILGPWLQAERQAETVAILLEALHDHPAGERRPLVEGVLREPSYATANRLSAVVLFVQDLDPPGDDGLVAVAGVIEDGPVLVELLRAIGARKPSKASPVLLDKMASTNATVRAAAVTALAEVNAPAAHAPILKLLNDADPAARVAAIQAAGKLTLKPAADQLLQLARDADPEVRRASLEALRRLREPRGLPVALAALADQETGLKALQLVGELGGPEQAGTVAELARRQPSEEILAAAGKVLIGWAARGGASAAQRQEVGQALANLHGGAGVLLAWHVTGPIPGDGADVLLKLAVNQAFPTGEHPAAGWRVVLAAGTDRRVPIGAAGGEGVWFACSELFVAEAASVELALNTPVPATVLVNGKVVMQRDPPKSPGPSTERCEASLGKGLNRIVVHFHGLKGPAEFQMRLRRKSASAQLERLAQAALARAGSAERGQVVFFNAEKSLCAKCHRVGDRGDRVGPDLTGLGSRFAKVYIVESILEPSRTVAPSFESTLVGLKDGKLLTGILVGETATSITLVDSETNRHVLAKADIEKQKRQAASAMPEGVEKRLTEQEFVDLVAFLASLKEPRKP